jgi:allophanate hydrolase
LAEPFTLGDGPIRVLPGPQEDSFTAEALETLFAADYEVTKDLDRMGIRLIGPSLAHHPERGAEILSEGMVPGCIQVPGSGQPILVLADGQTVGGYPKPGVVISADLPRLAALRPGDRLHFQAVTLGEAEAALDHLEGRIRDAVAAITEDKLVDGYDLEALQSGNLIGGVVDMAQPDHFPGHLEETPPCA